MKSSQRRNKKYADSIIETIKVNEIPICQDTLMHHKY